MLEEYRSSFHIYVMGPASDPLKQAQKTLEKLGYTLLRFDTLSEAVSEVPSCPPHFVVFSDQMPKKELVSIVATLTRMLPETHFLTFGARTAEFPPAEAFDIGLEGHIDASASLGEIKKIFDQRAQYDLDRYSREQNEAPMADFSFAEYLRAMKQENPIAHFVSNIVLPDPTDVLVYLRYFSARHILAVTAGQGLGSFENLGIDLSSDEKFQIENLNNPNSYDLIREFAGDTFQRPHFEARAVGYKNEPAGILLLASQASDVSERFQNSWVEALEHIYAVQLMKTRLENLDYFCPDTEALSYNGFVAEAKKEVARSRRLEKPTSLIVLQVDRWGDRSASMNAIQKKNWLRALYRFLVKHSRINDSVGHISEGIFGVLLPHTAVEGAKLKAERLRSLIENAELKVGGVVKRFTLSCGVSEYPRISTDSESLVQAALNVVSNGVEDNQCYLAPFLTGGSVDFEV